MFRLNKKCEECKEARGYFRLKYNVASDENERLRKENTFLVGEVQTLRLMLDKANNGRNSSNHCGNGSDADNAELPAT